MEAINTMLTSQLGPFGPILVVGILGLAMVIVALSTMMKKRDDPLDRLNQIAKPPKAATNKATALRVETKKDKLEKYSTFLEPQNEAEYSAARLKLLQAGYRSKNAVRNFHFIQFSLGIGMLVLGLIYAVFTSATAEVEPTTKDLAISVLLPAVAGYMLPKYWVNKRQSSRKESITNGFPDSLDMMLVCVEAGQSLDQAIIRVAREIRAGFPALADEFDLVAYEVKAGKDKVNVLRDMSERCGVTDVSSFVTVLIQSASFGTSIAEALRVYAAEMRDKRVMRAEEKANTLPTKMTLATMMLTVPPLLLILIGPSIYEISKVMSQAGV